MEYVIKKNQDVMIQSHILLRSDHNSNARVIYLNPITYNNFYIISYTINRLTIF